MFVSIAKSQTGQESMIENAFKTIKNEEQRYMKVLCVEIRSIQKNTEHAKQ